MTYTFVPVVEGRLPLLTNVSGDTNIRDAVMFAEREKDAVALAKRTRPHLILADIQLKDGDNGIAAVQRILLDHDTPELQLLQRVRDEAHRFAITHHRQRRDAAMTTSILDDLPGIGAARKRTLLNHFGSPEAILAASREQLESVPGLPGKTARELYAFLHRTSG